MGCVGFSEKVISRFESYLSGEIFKVNTDKKFSDPRHLTCSISKGSISDLLWTVNYSFA